MIRVTLFDGAAGWAIAVLSLTGSAWILLRIEDWLQYVQRPRVSRAGTWVSLEDGTQGVVLSAVGEMAAVRLADPDDMPGEAVWVPADRLRRVEYQELT
jgi:hypothetical protein